MDIHECAVIEDAPAGIMAGLAAGAKVFAVPGLLPLEEELAAKCTCIFSLYELIDLLDYEVDFEKALATLGRAREIIASKKEYEYREFFLSLYRVAILRAGILGSLREAYRRGDREVLCRVADTVLPEAMEEWERFFGLFTQLWDRNYKGFGLEMYTHDFGGALLRMKECRRILKEYLEGKRERIEELETPRLKLKKTWRSTPGYISRFRY